MPTTLNYTFVVSEEDNDILTVGFADNQFNTQEYLMFQSWLGADSQEERNAIYVERDGQQHGTYEGIKQITLFRDHLLIVFSPETAKILATEQDVIVLFSATDGQFQQLKDGLETVFAHTRSLDVRQQ